MSAASGLTTSLWTSKATRAASRALRQAHPVAGATRYRVRYEASERANVATEHRAKVFLNNSDSGLA